MAKVQTDKKGVKSRETNHNRRDRSLDQKTSETVNIPSNGLPAPVPLNGVACFQVPPRVQSVHQLKYTTFTGGASRHNPNFVTFKGGFLVSIGRNNSIEHLTSCGYRPLSFQWRSGLTLFWCGRGGCGLAFPLTCRLVHNTVWPGRPSEVFLSRNVARHLLGVCLWTSD